MDCWCGRTRGPREDLSNLEGLAEEALDLARACDCLLVLLAQLVHAQDGDDVLQVLVVLRAGASAGHCFRGNTCCTASHASLAAGVASPPAGPGSLMQIITGAWPGGLVLTCV